jgi:hypothetical protein
MVTFIKKWLRDRLLEFITLGLSFRKVVLVSSVRHCTSVFLGCCLRVFGGRRDICLTASTLLPWSALAELYLFPKLKIVMKETRFEAVSLMGQTDERTEGDTRRSIFSGILFIVWAMQTLFGSGCVLYWVTVLINFHLFCVVFYGLSGGT